MGGLCIGKASNLNGSVTGFFKFLPYLHFAKKSCFFAQIFKKAGIYSGFPKVVARKTVRATSFACANATTFGNLAFFNPFRATTFGNPLYN